MTALSYTDTVGIATAIGEQPIKGTQLNISFFLYFLLSLNHLLGYTYNKLKYVARSCSGCAGLFKTIIIISLQQVW